VLKQRQGQQGTDTLSTAIRRYRHRVVKIQRAWRGMLAVRRAKLGLWRMQWDRYTKKHGVGTEVPTEVVTNILARYEIVCFIPFSIRLISFFYPNYFFVSYSEYQREHRAAAAAMDSYSTRMADFRAANATRGHNSRMFIGAGVGGKPPVRPRVRVRLGGPWIRAAAEAVATSTGSAQAQGAVPQTSSGHGHGHGHGRRGGRMELNRRPSIGATLSRRSSVSANVSRRASMTSAGSGMYSRRLSVGVPLHQAPRRGSGVVRDDTHKGKS
jgi:hypothetical protein